MSESLRSVKHGSSLFRVMELMDKNPGNPIYRSLHAADEDFEYNEDTVFFKFFFVDSFDQYRGVLRRV